MLSPDRHIRRLPDGRFASEADEAEYRAQLEQQREWDREAETEDDDA